MKRPAAKTAAYQAAAYRAAISELLALVHVTLEAKKKSKRERSLALLVLIRIRQLHRRLAPIHWYTADEIEDAVMMVEQNTDVTRDPKLNGDSKQ